MLQKIKITPSIILADTSDVYDITIHGIKICSSKCEMQKKHQVKTTFWKFAGEEFQGLAQLFTQYICKWKTPQTFSLGIVNLIL